jgi:hypothetical protein
MRLIHRLSLFLKYTIEKTEKYNREREGSEGIVPSDLVGKCRYFCHEFGVVGVGELSQTRTKKEI